MVRSSEEFPLLAAYGLMACDTRGDGNCLFHALSDQVFGHQGRHEEIRAKVIVYMREHADDFKPFAPVDSVRRNPKRKNAGAYSSTFSFAPPTPEEVDRAFENHLAVMARGGTFGDNLEIQAFAKAYNTDVRIYNFDSSYYVRAINDGVVKPVVHIAYHTWEHYSSIRNIGGPLTGLPEVQIKDLSPEDRAKIKAAAAKVPVIHEWMVQAVTTSLPHLVDQVTIRKTLEEYHGRINDAVSKLIDLEYLSSTPGSPGSPSQSGGSSIERDPDSDDDEIYGPNKRQNRRMSRATKAMRKEERAVREAELPVIPTIELTEPGADLASGAVKLLSYDETHLKSIIHKNNNGSAQILSSDDEAADDLLPAPEDDAASEYSSTSRSQSAGHGSTPPRPQPHIILRTKTMQKQYGPQKKRITARERKELKKAAQKQARKEAKRKNSQAGRQLATSTINITTKRESPPMDQVIGIKTLYI